MIEIQSKSIHPSVRELLAFATSEDRVETEYVQHQQSANRKLYGYELYGQMIGCIGLNFTGSNECEIKHIAVSPHMRGQQIGRRMIQFICGKYSLKFIFAETDEDAVEFYRRIGFHVTSLGEKYPGRERFLCKKELP